MCGSQFGNQPNRDNDIFHFYGQSRPEDQKQKVSSRISTANPEGNFLVLHTDQLKEFDDGFWKWKDDTNGERDNVHFIRLGDETDPQNRLLFTMELCDFFIGFRQNYLYFLQGRTIIYWKWGEDKYCSVRCIAKLASDTKDLASKQSNFQTSFDDARLNAEFLEGYVHQNDSDSFDCVTLNFRGKGLYTFRTKSKNDKIQEMEDDNRYARLNLFDDEPQHKRSYTFACEGTYTYRLNKNERAPEGARKREIRYEDGKLKSFCTVLIEFEIFQNKEKITTMNFRVNNQKEEIETIPIEKEFAITGQKEFSLWIVT